MERRDTLLVMVLNIIMVLLLLSHRPADDVPANDVPSCYEQEK